MDSATSPSLAQLRAGIARAAKEVRHNPADEMARTHLSRLRADYAEAQITDYVAKIVAEAPPLNDEQRRRLRDLFRYARKP